MAKCAAVGFDLEESLSYNKTPFPILSLHDTEIDRLKPWPRPKQRVEPADRSHARDESIKIKMGDAFDIVGERKQTDWRKIAENLYEIAFEISLRNHKEEPVTVSVIEPMLWDLGDSSQLPRLKKIEAHPAQSRFR